MKKGLADITLIVDESGSMRSLLEATLKGIQNFIAEQREVPGEAVLTTYSFADTLRCSSEAVPLAIAAPPRDYLPNGNTALLDAIGTVVENNGRRYAAMAEDERPEHVILAILTDGEENASRTFTHARIKEMLKHQQEVYSWKVIFLGANIDVQEYSKALGIDPAMAAAYNATSVGTSKAYKAISDATRSIRSK